MEPFVDDPDFTLYVGDALTVLREMPDESVHCCVTSPPYFSLRDYGVEGQIGLEATPAAFVDALVAVFREVRRVLRSDGTFWLNIGDSYNNRNMSRKSSHQGGLGEDGDLKEKDLIGVPWMLAFALRADGWYLRAEVTWCKRNCMPESVTDRPTKATEKVFLFTKSPHYYYDADAVREPHQYDGRLKTTHDHSVNGSHENHPHMGTDQERWPNGGRNLRDWWLIATQPYADAHFATFPEALVEPCILAGTSERGRCPECGAPWERTIERTGWPDPTVTEDDQGRMKASGEVATDTQRRKALSGAKHAAFKALNPDRQVGWHPTCEHNHEPVAATVMDCFMGSGTTAHVARKHGRRAIGIELNPEYAALAARRLSQLSLLA